MMQTANSGREVLERAKQRLSNFAFVGLTERFDESLNLMCDTFGWSPVDDYEILNIGSNRPSNIDISLEARQLIQEHTLLDAELYEYAKQLFDARISELPSHRENTITS